MIYDMYYLYINHIEYPMDISHDIHDITMPSVARLVGGLDVDKSAREKLNEVPEESQAWHTKKQIPPKW